MAASRISSAPLPISCGYSTTSPRYPSAFLRRTSEMMRGTSEMMRVESRFPARPRNTPDQKNRKNGPKMSQKWVLLAYKESQKMRGGFKTRPQTVVAAGLSLRHFIVALDAADPALNYAGQLAPGLSSACCSNLRPSLSASTKMVSPSLNVPSSSIGASLSWR